MDEEEQEEELVEEELEEEGEVVLDTDEEDLSEDELDDMYQVRGLRKSTVHRYHNYYAIHGSPYTSAHVLIENTLGQHKWP